MRLGLQKKGSGQYLQNDVSANSQPAGSRVPRFLQRWSNIPWYLWLAPLIMGIFIVIIEIHDHQRMHQLHQSGQSLIEDSELVREIIFFGILFPILSGFLLTYLWGVGRERDEVARTLEERRAFINQIHKSTNWQNLVQFVVAFPGSFVDANRTFLLVQRSPQETFKMVSSWYAQEEAPGEKGAMIFPEVCQACAAKVSNQAVSTMACDHEDSTNMAKYGKRHCLWFVAGEEGKAALIFDVPLQKPLDGQKIQLLNDLGTEIALAIANANLTYQGEQQNDTAKSERQRIARDLHDTLGQNISYLHIKLDQLSANDTLTGIVEVQREIIKMRNVASQAYFQVRNTLAELRSEKQSPLREALQAYATEVSAHADFTIEVESRGLAGTLNPYTQQQILYITREALNNVEKHAHAHHVDINLGWMNQELMLQIIDDGVGFRPINITGGNRYGLLIMEERARMIGGALSITPNKGGGTMVTLSLPSAGKAAHDPERAQAN